MQEIKATDGIVDLETVGTAPGCKILTIGIAGVVRGRPDIPPATFYMALDPATTPGDVSRSTMAWWGKQSRESYQCAWGGKDDALEALQALDRWWAATFGKGAGCMWGNGSHFDVSILEWLYRQYNMGLPTPFYNVRDLRTIVDLSGVNKNAIAFEGYQHHALHDAVHEAKIFHEAYGALIGNVTQ